MTWKKKISSLWVKHSLKFNVSIDQYPLVAKYIVPEKLSLINWKPKTTTNIYIMCKQIGIFFKPSSAKIGDAVNGRESYFTVIPDRFLLPSIPLSQLPEGGSRYHFIITMIIR